MLSVSACLSVTVAPLLCLAICLLCSAVLCSAVQCSAFLFCGCPAVAWLSGLAGWVRPCHSPTVPFQSVQSVLATRRVFSAMCQKLRFLSVNCHCLSVFKHENHDRGPRTAASAVIVSNVDSGRRNLLLVGPPAHRAEGRRRWWLEPVCGLNRGTWQWWQQTATEQQRGGQRGTDDEKRGQRTMA